MVALKTSRFDLSQIGEADRLNLSATFFTAMKRFYDDPANRARFERWQKQQRLDAPASPSSCKEAKSCTNLGSQSSSPA